MKDKSGFTLLELLVSMTLISLLIVILSLALRSGINAYTRAKEFNKRFFPISAVKGLLFRQLESIISENSKGLSNYIYFSGKQTQLAFTTTYSPQGLGTGGILLVAYGFDSENNRLLYAQKVITRLSQVEDIKDDFFRQDFDFLKKKGWKIEELQGIKKLSFTYRPPFIEESVEPEDWPDKFKQGRQLPSEVAINLTFEEKNSDQTKADVEIIPVGIF